MAKCCRFFSECRSHAFIKLRYCGMALCKVHYAKNIEDRIEKAISHYHMLAGTFGRPEKWVVLADGTPASQVLLAVLLKRFKSDPKIILLPVFIEYGTRSSVSHLKAVTDLCAKYDVTPKVVDFAQECGRSLADVSRASSPYLVFDGLRGMVLAKVARESGAAKVAVPTCLEDEAASLFRSFLNMDVERLSHQYYWETKERAVPASPVRVPPLVEVSAEEARMYAYACDVPCVDDDDDDVSNDVDGGLVPKPPVDAVKKHLMQIELDRVGNMLNMVRRYHKVFLPAIEAHKSAAPKDSRIEDVEEHILPIKDVDVVEQQAVPCKRCKLMCEDDLCRACCALDACPPPPAEEKCDKSAGKEEKMDVDKKMPECEFFLTTSLNNPGAKRKWKKRVDAKPAEK